jgi:hypothetical protein
MKKLNRKTQRAIMKLSLLITSLLLIFTNLFAQDYLKTQQLHEELLIREQTPFTEGQVELFNHGGFVWQRHYGENEYYITARSYRGSMPQGHHQSGRKALEDQQFIVAEVFLDETSRPMLESLSFVVPGYCTDGYINVCIQKCDFDWVKENGGIIEELSSYGSETYPGHNTGGGRTTDILFEEGFEVNPVPSVDWAVGDNNAGSGEDTWGDVGCESNSGSRSAWCAGTSSSQNPCDVYDNDMEAFMEKVNPVTDLSSYENLTFAFYVNYATPGSSDIFTWDYNNGSGWTNIGLTWFGNSGGWIPESVNLTGVWNEFRMRFRFESDGSGTDNGVYVDDILFSGDYVAPPILCAYPDTIYLGVHHSGYSYSEEFTVENCGEETLNGNITEDATWISTINPDNFSLEMGDTVHVTVAGDFPPASTGMFSTYIQITSNGGNDSVYIYGEASDEPILCVDPLEIDLGTHSPGFAFMEDFTVENCNVGTLTGNISAIAGWISNLSPTSFSLTAGQTELISVDGNFPSMPGYFETFINITSNGGNEQVHLYGIVELDPVLCAAPDSIYLGTHAPEYSYTSEFKVGNCGGGTLTGTVTESADWISTLNPDSFTVAGGDSVMVTFGGDFPAVSGPFSTYIQIMSDGGDDSIYVSGVVELPPALCVTPTSIDLGTNSAGFSFNESFTVENCGEDTLAGDIFENVAWITTLAPDTFELGPFANTQVTVAGDFPSAVGPFFTYIQITSNGGNDSVHIFGIVEEVPQLCVDPVEVNLGVHPPGYSFVDTIEVENCGQGTLTGTLTTDAAFITSINPDEFSLLEDETLEITFAGDFPSVTGYFSSYIYVESNGGFQQVFVFGTVEEEPELCVSPAQVNLGTHLAGYVFEETFTVSNCGEGTLTGNLSAIASWITNLTPVSFELGAEEDSIITVGGEFPETPGYFESYIDIVTNTGTTQLLIFGTVGMGPAICVEPMEIDLGTHIPGFPINNNFLVESCGEEVLTGNIAAIASWISNITPTSFELAGGETTTIVVTGEFPSNPGFFEAFIDVTSNAGNEQVRIFGTVSVQPSQCLAPNEIDLGTIASKTAISETFSIENCGGGFLLGNATENANFILSLTPSAFNLASGASQSITITGVAPDENGYFESYININSNAGFDQVYIHGEVNSEPQACLTPENMDLGIRQAAEEFIEILTVRNCGGAQLIGNLTENADWINNMVPSAFVLDPAEEIDITISGIFPNDTGTFESWISITSNAGFQQLRIYGMAEPNSIDELLNESNIAIYPNPVSGVMTIEALDQQNSITEFYIFSTTGERYYTDAYSELNNNRVTVDTRLLPNGLYIIRIVTEEGFAYRKFIKVD